MSIIFIKTDKFDFSKTVINTYLSLRNWCIISTDDSIQTNFSINTFSHMLKLGYEKVIISL